MGEGLGFGTVAVAVFAAHALKISDLWGIVALFTGIASAVYSVRMRTTLDATKDAAEAWKEERDAEKAKSDRLEDNNKELLAENERLRAATNLQSVVEAIEKMTEKMVDGGDRASIEHAAILRSLETLTARLEKIASDRPDT